MGPKTSSNINIHQPFLGHLTGVDLLAFFHDFSALAAPAAAPGARLFPRLSLHLLLSRARSARSHSTASSASQETGGPEAGHSSPTSSRVHQVDPFWG